MTEIPDDELGRELWSFFGPKSTAVLMGWVLLWWAQGLRSREAILLHGLGSQGTRYRVVNEFRSFAAHLAAQGWVLSADEVLERVADHRFTVA